MGESIRIGAEEGQPGLSALVDRTGAWVRELTLDGINVFYPKQDVEVDGTKKTRGGIHVCSLHFGPDPEGKGAQHGYARDVEWAIAGSDLRYVRLRHIDSEGEHTGVQHELGLQIVDLAHIKILAANLSVTNNGDRDIVVTPGFHPYFSGPAEFNECHKVAQKDSRAERKGNYSIRTVRLLSGITVSMVAVNCPESTVWSDSPNDYHCVEPSVLPLNTPPGEEDVLKPEHTRSYAVSFVVKEQE